MSVYLSPTIGSPSFFFLYLFSWSILESERCGPGIKSENSAFQTRRPHLCCCYRGEVKTLGVVSEKIETGHTKKYSPSLLLLYTGEFQHKKEIKRECDHRPLAKRLISSSSFGYIRVRNLNAPNIAPGFVCFVHTNG
jgi:hypothetical protein